ncbi:MAG: carbohydrate kinase family protein [Patescibacteria group bacterium]|nr:carbohydrate kinase family protein [Patescibacteria group bacterium]
MSKRIFVTGSVAYDRIMDFPGFFKNEILPEKLHILNVSFFVRELKESFGGTAGNIAYNLALLGMRPSLIANVGVKDFIVYESWLKKNKIDLSQIKIYPNQQTAGAYIITDQADNQISGFFPGAMGTPVSGRKFSVTGGNLAIIAPQNPVDMVKLPEIFKRQKISYIFDPGQQVTSLSSAQLKKAICGSEVLIGNDYEISLITKKTSWTNEVLAKKTKMLVTTLGDKGSIIIKAEKKYLIPPAKPKKVLDPTGAGDAYRAGLIKGLSANWPLSKVGRFAGLVSVYTVEKFGTQTHSFNFNDLAKRYQQNFKEKL